MIILSRTYYVSLAILVKFPIEILQYGWRLRVWGHGLSASNIQLHAQSHIGVYIFHTLRPDLLKFRTEDIHKNKLELQLDYSF
jgi:hypothetical protein